MRAFALPFIFLLTVGGSESTSFGAVADYVYHEATRDDMLVGAAGTTCVGPQRYVEVQTPTAAQNYVLRFQVGYRLFTDNARVYYTTNGSAPSGALGVPSSGTQVVVGQYTCVFTNGGLAADVVTATIPALPAGTMVNYIIGAWDSASGIEIFANGGTCTGCQVLTNATQATVFQYGVAVPPSITQPPSNLSVLQGATASFSVVASGTAPLRYQWLFNDDPLAGETNATLTIPSVSLANSGTYIVVVTNVAGATLSPEAKLTVLVPPSILQQPASVMADPGDSVTFQVLATGSQPLVYQWRKDGGPMAGATNEVLNLVNVQLADQGFYTVLVTNLGGSVLSEAAGLSLGTPPVIQVQPVSLTVTQGQSVILSASATGSEPLAYQWLLNGTNLVNATNAVYSIAGAYAADAGEYRLQVSNPFGEVTSDPAILTVQLPPTITRQPSSQSVLQGELAAFTVEASGAAPLRYQWIYASTELLPGATNASLVISNAQPARAGPYQVLVSNPLGAVLSEAALLTVLVPPTIVAQPVNRNVVEGFSTQFSVTVSGTAPFSFQWRKDGTSLSGATNQSLVITNAGPANAGIYDVLITNVVGAILSQPATLTVYERPRITLQPASVTATQGWEVQFSVEATGTAPLRYRWLFNATNLLAGATNRTLVLTNVQALNAGSYQAAVSNVAGMVVSDPATLTVLRPPVIVVQPVSLELELGTNATFSVVAQGQEPLSYQWRFNGFALADRTNSSLVITNIRPVDYGTYTVAVSNAIGFVISQPATLSERQPPAIVVQPQSQTVTNGQDAFFTVTASGTPPLSYQWYFGAGTPLPGATNSGLTLTGVNITQAGDYHVVVSNAAGQATSASATLTVFSVPVVPPAPVLVTATNQLPASLQVPVAGTPPYAYQWFFQGTNLLAGATNAALSLQPVAVTNEGLYQVRISNQFGQATGAVQLVVRTEDFGDAPDGPFATFRSSNGARHRIEPGIRLGATIDYENDGQPHPQARGDDLAGLADEDGVVFLTPILFNQTARVAVQASTNGLLNGWIDFNRNGAWTNAGERVFTDVPLAPGSNELSIPVPSSAQLGEAMARFRFSRQSGLAATGPAPDGEVEDYLVRIDPAVDLVVRARDAADPVSVGGTINVTATVTNSGPNPATGVVLTRLPFPGTAFLQATPSQGSCTVTGETVRCNLGTLASAAGASVAFQVRALSAGTKTNLFQATAVEADINLANNLAAEPTGAIFSVPTYANLDAIVGPDFDVGPAFPYPTSITVSGLTSAVYKATVTISGMTHTYPDDFDILLVGPQGQSVILMSDAGLGFYTPINNVTLTFDDDAAAALPDSDQIVSGTYRPSNYGSQDVWNPPAPGGPYGSRLDVFRGTNPNGTWSLYVVDDLPEDNGFIADGWRLQLSLMNPFTDLSVSLVDAPDPVSVTSNVTYTVTITNRGPSVANGVLLENPVPPGTQFVSASASQGGCALESGVVRCQLGQLAPARTATATLRFAAVGNHSLTNTVAVSAYEQDTNPANNTAQAVTGVILINDLALTATARPEPVLLGQTIEYQVGVTNLGPYNANQVVVTNRLPAGLQFVSAATSQGTCTNLNGVLQCSVGTLTVGGGAALLVTVRTVALGSITNVITVIEGEADFNPANNTARPVSTVVPAADLVLSQTDNPDPVVVGLPVAYTLVVTNAGPSQATGVTLENPLPAASLLLSMLPTQGNCTNDNGVVRCALGALDAGAQASVVLQIVPQQSGALTNQAVVLASQADPQPDNNRSEVVTTVAPAADLAVTMVDQQDPVLLGEPLIYLLSVTNRGPDAAQGVTVIDTLSPDLLFVSALPSQGTCSNQAGRIECSLGPLPLGGQATILLTVRPTATGPVTNRAEVTGLRADLVPDNNQDWEVSSVIIDTGLFANTEPFTIHESGPASLYPSTIFVSGVTVRVDSVSVTLSNLTHSYADDLDVLLVGPAGQSVLLLSDAGGSSSLLSTTLTFSDEGNSLLPDEGSFGSGTYRPTQYEPESDLFAEPAPPAPYETNLAVFKGTDVNGAWSLYIMDDFPKDQGVLQGGWSLRFATLEKLADLAVGLAAAPSPVALGSNLTYSVLVTNRGPAFATGVTVTNLLPAGVELLDIQADQGSCTNDAGMIACELGDMVAGQVVTVRVEVRVTSLEPKASEAGVTALEIDVRPSNNLADLLTLVQEPPQLTLQPVSLTVTNGDPAMFMVEATGQEPLRFQWLFNGAPLAGQTNATLVYTHAQAAQDGIYTVRVSNEVGAVESDPAVLQVLVPITILEPPRNILIVAGNTAQFQVEVEGSEPLTYQWLYNGGPLPGAEAASLTIPNVQPANAGSYQVVVRNSLSTAISPPATLFVQVLDLGDAPGSGFPTLVSQNGARHTINPAIRLGAQIDSDPDGLANAQAMGDDLTGLDDEDGVTFLTPLVPGNLALLQVVASTNGWLNAWVDFDANGSWVDPRNHALTNVALATGTNVVEMPVPASAIETNATFARFRFSTLDSLSYEGPAPNGEVEDYAVEIVRLTDLVVSVTDAPDPVRVGFNLLYQVGVTNQGLVTASNTVLSLAVPAGLSVLSVSNSQGYLPDPRQPLAQLGALPPGSGASMTVAALALVPGRVSATATATARERDLNPADNTVLVVTDIAGQPTIVKAPTTQLVVQGQTATFTVTATGHLLSYQWRFNGQALPGADQATLVLPNVQPEQGGAYSVLVSNLVGTALSTPVSLTVLLPPTFTQQPQSVVATPGQTVTFNAAATGTQPIAYQWQRYGVNLPGQTNTSLTLLDVQTETLGVYALRAVNAAGTNFSAPARLDLPGPPLILAQPQSRTNLFGSRAVFEVRATGSQPLQAQWFFNQVPLPQATNLTLILPQVHLTNAGLYHVTLINPEGQAVSDLASLTVLAVDFGDAPSPYPTLLAQDGARHVINWEFYLGLGIDPEPDGLPSNDATGDDTNEANDENGVVFLTDLLTGQIADLEVSCSQFGYLNAWLDFDNDGSWTQPGDQIFTNQTLNRGLNLLQFQVPATAQTNHPTIARFRLSRTLNLSFTGLANEGEVEDYAVSIRPSADLGLFLTASAETLITGSNLVYTLVVTNLGPAPATGVRLDNVLPPQVSLANVLPTQGTWTNLNGMVRCELGQLDPKSSATIQIDTLALRAGTATNVAQVTAHETDPRTNNNVAGVTSVVTDLPLILQQPADVAATNGSSAFFEVVAISAAPLTYQWQFNETNLPGRTNAALLLVNVNPASFGAYRVRITNTNGSVFSQSAQLIPATPPVVATLAPSFITSTNALLNGQVNPRGLATAAWFEWGTTTNYGNTTAALNVGSGILALPFAQNLAGLEPGNVYHCRLAATNLLGLAVGENFAFSWNETVPVITQLNVLPDGQAQILFSGADNQVYLIEASPDLITWTNLGPGSPLAPGEFQFHDSESPELSHRFYRIIAP